MSETVTSQFRVIDNLNNELILKDVKKGLTVIVQKEKWRYDEEMWKNIKTISSDNMYKFVLESQNKKNTIWCIKQFSKIN